MIYRNNLKVKEGGSSTCKYESFEYSYIHLNNGSDKLLVICIYRKQEISCKSFCVELELFMDALPNKDKELIVVGDFNVWDDVPKDPDAKILRTLMSAYGLTQIIKDTTHNEGHILDHVYINKNETNLNCEVCEDKFGISTDHFHCLLKLPCTIQNQKEEMITTRKLKNIDMVVFRNGIKTIINDVRSSDAGFEESYNKFKVPAEALLNTLAPEVTMKVKSKKNAPKWIDEEYKKERAERRKLERKWKKSKSDEDREQYVQKRNLCAKLSLTKQEKYFSSIIESSNNQQKTLFKVVNEVLDKKAERILPAHTDPVELANKFNQYYIEKIDKLRKSIPTTSSEVDDEKNLFRGVKLESFAPTTPEEVRKLIKEHGVKTSSEDPLPSVLITSVMEEMIPFYVELVNKSFAEGTLDGIKHSEIDPLLKKHGLDSDVYKNYRPVNNLIFLSKLVERIAQKRIDGHMQVNNLFTAEFFGYKQYHSTETMMVGATDEILSGFDDGKCTIMVFLDLSAAFDTIDIDRLVEILGEEIGLAGTALKWCKSFLSNRTQRVKINGQYSECLLIKFGTVQGSVLGPKFFNIYVRSQPKIFQSCGFLSTAFADDSNGRKTFSLLFQYNVLKNDVSNCTEKVMNWMTRQFMKVNPDKTEMILFHPKSLQNEVIIGGTFIGEECIRFSKVVKNVGVYLDNNLKMDKHINSTVSHCYSLLKNIGRIRNILSDKHTEMLVHSVITSRLDYCNSLFINISKANIFKLQKVQNAAARLVVRGKKRCSMTEVLRKLHWLRIESRIIFKLLLIVFKCIYGQCSSNLVNMIKYKSHQCRPQDHLLLETRRVKTKYGRRTFSYVGPKLWNALPLHIRSEECIDKFKTQVKTLLFDGTEQLKKSAFRYD